MNPAWLAAGIGSLAIAFGAAVACVNAGGATDRELPWFVSCVGWLVAAFVCLVRP